jgi:hypothetical protein
MLFKFWEKKVILISDLVSDTQWEKNLILGLQGSQAVAFHKLHRYCTCNIVVG